MNQLLNEAIRRYLRRRGRKERELEAQLAALRAYRKKDPGFKYAIDAFVKAEVSQKDPLEGEPIEDLNEPVGPVQSKMREVMGG
jgi:hypothetical protein